MEPIVRNPYLFREIARYLEIFEIEALNHLGDDFRQLLISPVFDEVKRIALSRWMDQNGSIITKNNTSIPMIDLTTAISVDFRHSWLTRLPESIGFLSLLRYATFKNNRLKRLPKSIGQFNELQDLDLGYNRLTSLPKSIGQLNKLEKLWLNNNKLNKLPESIGLLKNLRWLWLSNNKLTSLPKSLNRRIIQDDRLLWQQR
jgi:Leucine-rich repeat (LRR) protein